jgi:uncharacterized membrane protein YqiK
MLAKLSFKHCLLQLSTSLLIIIILVVVIIIIILEFWKPNQGTRLKKYQNYEPYLN